jgi:hypothetical protein
MRPACVSSAVVSLNYKGPAHGSKANSGVRFAGLLPRLGIGPEFLAERCEYAEVTADSPRPPNRCRIGAEVLPGKRMPGAPRTTLSDLAGRAHRGRVTVLGRPLAGAAGRRPEAVSSPNSFLAWRHPPAPGTRSLRLCGLVSDRGSVLAGLARRRRALEAVEKVLTGTVSVSVSVSVGCPTPTDGCPSTIRWT